MSRQVPAQGRKALFIQGIDILAHALQARDWALGREGDDAVIEVSDTGPGIPPDELGKVREFARAIKDDNPIYFDEELAKLKQAAAPSHRYDDAARLFRELIDAAVHLGFPRHIAHDLGCERERINIKATTSEGLGAFGRREGLACHAVVLLAHADGHGHDHHHGR